VLAGMIEIDGSQGEGGGQVLRTALSLSLCTGQPFRMHGIRARRSKPGLMRQHLTAVNAAARIGAAEIEGAALGSQQLSFRPQAVRPGDWVFDVGTAGSTTLVLQTLLPPLLTAEQPSTLTLRGGTHNPLAPPFEFLSLAFLPLLARMGAQVTATLERCGFFPAGGGEIRVQIHPARRLAPLALDARGAPGLVRAEAIVCRLPVEIARRELAVVRSALNLPESALRVIDDRPAAGPGNVLLIVQAYEYATEVFAGFGARGVRAEQVAQRAVDEALRFARSAAAVGEHLADQLLLPLALAGAGHFTTLEPSAHTRTNIAAIRQFLPVHFELDQRAPDLWRVEARSEAPRAQPPDPLP
jgi:RNA 3'-terminal phosphate cyclase (ATP)